MPKGIGRQIQIGLGREVTRGTPVAPAFWIPHTEAGIEERFENAIDEATIGVIEDSIGAVRVKDWAEGNYRAPIGDRHFGLPFLAALGTLVTTANTPEVGVHTHNLTVRQDAQHPSLTIGIDDPLGVQDYQHANAVLSSLEINYELGKILEYVAVLRARRGATATLSPSVLTENRFTHRHFTLRIAATQAGLDAAPAQNIRAASLKIEKNVEDDMVLGSVAPIDFLNKQFSIDGTIEAIWQNETDFKNFVIAGLARALRFDLVNTDVTIGTTTRPRVRIDLHRVIFSEITRPVRINDLVYQTLAFKAHYSTADARLISASIINTQASY